MRKLHIPRSKWNIEFCRSWGGLIKPIQDTDPFTFFNLAKSGDLIGMVSCTGDFEDIERYRDKLGLAMRKRDAGIIPDDFYYAKIFNLKNRGKVHIHYLSTRVH